MSTVPPPATAPPPSPPVWQPPPLRRWQIVVTLIAALVALLAILAAWDLWPFGRGTQTTDNAYVRGRVAFIAPQVSGGRIRAATPQSAVSPLDVQRAVPKL